MNLDRKDIAIGGGIVILSGLVYWRYRHPGESSQTPEPVAAVPVARASNSSDSLIPAGGGGSSPYMYSPAPETSPTATVAVPETSTAVLDIPSTEESPPAAPETSYVAPPMEWHDPAPAYSPPAMPSYFTPGNVPGFPLPGSIYGFLGAPLGHRQVDSGDNSGGHFNTWEFWFYNGTTGRANFYTSGSKALNWVGLY